MRIGPNQLLSTDPEVLRRMSAVRSGYTKGKFYASGKIVPGVDNVVSLRDPAKHKEMRALMAPGVSQLLPTMCTQPSKLIVLNSSLVFWQGKRRV